MRQITPRKGPIVAFPVLVVLLLGALALTACANTAVQAQPRDITSPQQYGGSYARGTATGDTQAGAAFARWVLDQDPQAEYMTDAIMRNEDSLGVKIQPNVTKQEVRQLLISLTEGMARTFPGRPLTVIAFYQSGAKLAQANYDPSTDEVAVDFLQ